MHESLDVLRTSGTLGLGEEVHRIFGHYYPDG